MELTDFTRLREIISAVVGSIREKARQRILELQSGKVLESAEKIFANSIITSSGMFELLGDGTVIRFLVHVPQGPSEFRKDNVPYSEKLMNSKYWHKYHLFQCQTVKEWHQNMRKSSRNDGLMIYLLKNKGSGSGEYDSPNRKIGRKLVLCKKCRNELPWKIRNQFDLAVFMKTGPLREELLKYTDLTSVDQIPNQYVKEWNVISRQIKALRKWTCEECKLYLGKNEKTRSFLEAHHKDRRRDNNEHINLIVLCEICHSKYHPENSLFKKQATALTHYMKENPLDFPIKDFDFNSIQDAQYVLKS